ncbi:S8 family serine peptidase [Candidatus Acetothermia bacterium]|nr:S8 family serine peptidase [Candidatus Acetothermia bacterium]MBI3643608.1 S8 family serine peptidase [Candidatus Acetothermia bacterium]
MKKMKRNIFRLRIRLILSLLCLALIPVISTSSAQLPQGTFIDLSLERNFLSDQAIAGKEIHWQLLAKNRSSTDADNVLVREILPDGVSLIEAKPDMGSCTLTNNETFKGYECQLGTLAASQQIIVDVQASIAEDFPFKSIFSTAYIIDQAGSLDPDLSNNISADEHIVIFKPKILNLLVSPVCTTVASQVLITGSDLKSLYATNPAVKVNGKAANAIFFGETSLSVQIPELSESTAKISINSVPLSQTLQIDSACTIHSISVDDVRSGFIAGDLLLFFKSTLTLEQLEQFRSLYGFDSLSEYPLLGVYRGRLAQHPELKEEADNPSLLSCPALTRRTSPEIDLTLLVDVSGTMDSIALKDVLDELTKQMNCVFNLNSRISLITYRDQPTLVLPMDTWETEQSALNDWVNTPLVTDGKSDLEGALLYAANLLKAQGRPDVPKGVFVITRGPSVPTWADKEGVYHQFTDNNIFLSGIAMTNLLMPKTFYQPLEELSQKTERDIIFRDERNPTGAAHDIPCSIVLGIYGILPCPSDPLTHIPTHAIDYAKQTELLMERIAADPKVDQICLNTLVESKQFSDPDLPQQAWLQNLGVQHIQDFFPHLGDGVTVAIIDTGVDLTLSQLGELHINSNMPDGINFATAPSGPTDGSDVLGHGTSVASITAASGNNINGIGVAPKATIVPIRVFAPQESGGARGNSLWVAEALAAAYLMGADVINLSLGDQSNVKIGCKKLSSEDFYNRVLNHLGEIAPQNSNKRPILVAATGNDGRHKVRCPACLSRVIAVGSVHQNDAGQWERSSFSNWGPSVDFVAQGEGINTTLNGGSFGDTGPGTSFTAPQVSGLVALILGEEPHLLMDQVVQKIKACFSQDLLDPGWDEQTGWGRIVIPDPNQAPPACLPQTQ